MTADPLAEVMVEAGRWLAGLGLAPGSSGNISMRSEAGFLLTPTGCPLGRLEPDGLCWLDASGALISGGQPTKELPLHLAVYAARPAAAAIVHLHSRNSVALSCLEDLDPNAPLAPLTPYQVMRLDPVLVVPYAMPGSSELAALVGRRAAESPLLLLANHGLVVAGASLDEAVVLAEELEEAAALALLLAGRPTRTLDADAVATLRARVRPPEARR